MQQPNHHDYIQGVLLQIAEDEQIQFKRNHAMTQQTEILNSLSAVRAEALTKDTKEAAVDFAVIGTATALQTAVQVTGDAAAVFTDLGEALTKHFEAEVNGEACEVAAEEPEAA